MTSVPEILKALRSKTGLTREQFASLMGMATSTWQHYETRFKKKELPRHILERAREIFLEFGISDSEILVLSPPLSEPVNNNKRTKRFGGLEDLNATHLRSLAPSTPRHSPQQTVPVYGGEIIRDMIKLDDKLPVIEAFTCPPGLLGKADIYAIYVPGMSMAPRFRAGEPVFVNPHISPGPGDDVELHVLENESDIRLIVREFIEEIPEIIRVKQHSPQEKITEYAHTKIKKLQRICTVSELLGI